MTRAVFRNFVRDRRANVAMIFALSVLPLVFAVGMSIDYGAAARLKSKLNAAADSAALAAVAPSMLLQTDTVAQTAAYNMFNAEASGLSRLIFNGADPTQLAVTITHPTAATRNVTVAYSAQSQNIFGNILHWNTIPFSGSSQGSATMPPNINFYLLIDTSPSMAIPATATGIQQMVTATPHQTDGSTVGCAFACHETNPSADNLGNPGGEDNYTLARNLGIPLRIDSVAGTSSSTGAAQNMVQYAINQAAQNVANYGYTPTYQIAIDTFNTGIQNLFPLTSNLSNLVTQLSANPSPIQLMEVYDNNNECTAFNSSGACTASVGNSDTDTNIDAALTALNTSTSSSYIPTAGNGYAPNPPNQVLMIITDGVEDETVSTVTAGSSTSAPGGLRQQSPMAANTHTPSYALCQALQARGIQIAILYTTYFPLDPGGEGSWYDSYIYQFQPNAVDQIGPDLQNNCASPGLFITVPVGGNISAGLNALFQLAIDGSHLTQ